MGPDRRSGRRRCRRGRRARARSIRARAASERHIKDCEDLLTLAAGLLPTASLDIHYRSAHRELIAFSNAAYYDGKLNIPVRRPAEDVKRAKPIEVRRVDGLYRNQTNADEAAAIVDLLGELWASRALSPTVGVVTFNMKQAELIEMRLRQRADEDRKFARALDRERTRSADGEDVGFFVRTWRMQATSATDRLLDDVRSATRKASSSVSSAP
jgi:hypothetical protein